MEIFKMSACGHHNYSFFIIHYSLFCSINPIQLGLLSQTDKHIKL